MWGPTQATLPSEIRQRISGNIVGTSSVDFNGDGHPDYLVAVEIPRSPGAKETPDPYASRYWFTSSFRLVKKTPIYIQPYNYIWFADLDSTTDPFIISAEGFSDGIDYAVYRQDFKAGKDILLFRFYPVLLDSKVGKKTYHWGYPWDISDLILKRDRGVPLILCSFDSLTNADKGGIEPPKWQKRVPIVFFKGRPTQESNPGKIRTLHWLSLDQIIEQCRKGAN